MGIYRDVFMLLLFGMSIHFIKAFIDNRITKPILVLPFIILSIYLLFLLRAYLGFSLIISFVLYHVKFTRKKVFYLLLIYFFSIIAAKEIGVLDDILRYRGEDGFASGGATLGIGLLNSNSAEFLFLYVYSAIMQLFGFFIVSTNALGVFVLESIPFIIAFFYIFKNRELLSLFSRYLLIFSIIYASVWVMGNDNLGTAVRLRVFNYISIYIVVFMVYFEKYKIQYLASEAGSLKAFR